ncbi:conserved hypothetical protein [Theileria equi strain WA]|uniref:tRNA-intron lyase n=1 Tax=Theileria equi strain WA TaxID=1537102 RepID=L1LF07_THEEQ|nr:conserved hypothetical protein [Theileria equi strain WA]EKX73936.1 conserved hypothetical protein [Theileria equi strain WA]|eukprot:XP_004833388.1 conserved hypothetical protein [Theileria equi strain WA]
MCEDNSLIYENLTSKGLIVKDGMHYGADFSVYEGKPNECHSHCLVFAKHTDDVIPAKSLVRWTRTSAFVNKKAVVAFVNCSERTVRYASIERQKLD